MQRGFWGMTSFLLLILVGLILGSFTNGIKVHKLNSTESVRRKHGEQSALHKLTAEDREKYFLKIDSKKISRLHDTVYDKRKCKFFNVPAIFFNSSNDTLHYVTMSCSWDDFFSINNKNLSVLSWPCDSNFPVEKILPPHKSIAYNRTIVLRDGYIKGEKFAIGMNLFIINRKNRNSVLDFPMDFDRKTNLIWSNKVEIP